MAFVNTHPHPSYQQPSTQPHNPNEQPDRPQNTKHPQHKSPPTHKRPLRLTERTVGLFLQKQFSQKQIANHYHGAQRAQTRLPFPRALIVCRFLGFCGLGIGSDHRTRAQNPENTINHELLFILWSFQRSRSILLSSMRTRMGSTRRKVIPSTHSRPLESHPC